MNEILLALFIGLATTSSAMVGTAIGLLVAILCEALAGGAVLVLIAHTMILEAIHEGGSLTVCTHLVDGFVIDMEKSKPRMWPQWVSWRGAAAFITLQRKIRKALRGL